MATNEATVSVEFRLSWQWNHVIAPLIVFTSCMGARWSFGDVYNAMCRHAQLRIAGGRWKTVAELQSERADG